MIVEGQAGSIVADPELLKIAFQNLLLNAAQAVRGQGRIRVRLHHSGTRTIIDIVDTGPGIPLEHHERLFTPFFTTKARGTGLGLATVRRIAEAHDGEVGIVETGSAGTVVRVSLPTSRDGHPQLA